MGAVVQHADRRWQIWTSGTKTFGVVGPVTGRTVTNARRIEVAGRYRAARFDRAMLTVDDVEGIRRYVAIPFKS